MFGEERIEDKFSTYRGREEFIRELMEVVDNKVTDEEIEEISELLEVSKN